MKVAPLLLAMLLLPIPVCAGQLNNADALNGLKTIKVVCDVNVGDPETLLWRMELIDETYTQLLDAGIQPTFVVTFRGPATNFVTRGTGHVPLEDRAIKKKIQGWVGQFHKNGFALEQCAIAAHALKIPIGDILPQITVVRNGYISIVAYQNKGYALLPMD